jgi:hypothetical protein
VAVRRQPHLRPAVEACAELTKKIATLSTLHMGLIRHYLIDPMNTMTPEERTELAGLTVQPSAGTGGMSHEETRRISQMRAEHPLAVVLRDAAKELKR